MTGLSITLISPLVLVIFGDTKMIYQKVKRDDNDIDSYWDVFMKYMLSNFVLFSTYCISEISFLKVPKLVIFREATLKKTFVAIVIVIVQLAIAIVLMLSVK